MIELMFEHPISSVIAIYIIVEGITDIIKLICRTVVNSHIAKYGGDDGTQI